MTTDSFVKGQLALLCWRNAPGGKAFEAMRCIALVERNRIQAGWHGGDWLTLIENDALYSAYAPLVTNGAAPALLASDNPLGPEPMFPDLRNDVFQRFLWEVDRIYDGQAADPMTEGALWHADAERPITRAWFLDKIARDPERHPRVAQVASLTLWR